MTVSLWLLFVVTFVSALAIPAPNAGYAIAQTLANGPKSGLLASAGFAFTSGLNLLIVYSAYALFASKFMSKLKSNTSNKIVGIIYTFAAGAIATIGK